MVAFMYIAELRGKMMNSRLFTFTDEVSNREKFYLARNIYLHNHRIETSEKLTQNLIL